jgi:anaerobic selenocysteine-containing dehydrogenase
MAFLATMSAKPALAKVAPVVLYRTLGPTLPDGAASAAALWAAAHRAAQSYQGSLQRAGHAGEGPMAGEALFDAILTGRSGVVLTDDDWDEVLRRVKTPDGRVHLLMPELVDELNALRDEPPTTDPEWPFVLTAGERRSFTANTIMRDPTWRKRDQSGALRIHPADAARLGVEDGGLVRVTTRRGQAQVTVEVDDRMQAGHVSIPNGLGLDHAEEGGERVVTGVAPNGLTSAGDRDPWAGTPWHKHVPARLEAIA